MANGDGNENKLLYISHSDTYNIGEINSSSLVHICLVSNNILSIDFYFKFVYMSINSHKL